MRHPREGVWAGGLRRGETCMRQGRSRCEGGWSALHSLLQPPNTHCGGPVCPLGLVPLALTVGMEVWEFPPQLTAEHVVLKTRSESQPDCFLSVPATQKSGAAFRQKGGGQRVNCLQLKTILMPYFGGAYWSPSVQN